MDHVPHPMPTEVHAFATPPLRVNSLSTYASTHSTTLPHTPSQQQSLNDATDRARAYKSRNKRPCDFCRYKKAACHLDSRPPCELCIRYNKECTFVESPAKRRRPNEAGSSVDHGQPNSASHHDFRIHPESAPASTFLPTPIASSMDLPPEYMGWDHVIPPFHIPSMPMSPHMPNEFGHFAPMYQEQLPSRMHFGGFEPMTVSSNTPDEVSHPVARHRQQSSIGTSPSTRSATAPPQMNLNLPHDLTSGEPSLENQAFSNSQIVGMSGEIDPFLMSRFRFDDCNEALLQSIRVRKMSDGPLDPKSVPTFFHISHNALASKAQPPEQTELLDRYRREVDEMVAHHVGKRLIRLFYRYVQPYFPVLTRDGGWERDMEGIRDPASIPTCILAAIYGHALAFCAWDEKLCVDVYTPPSADALFKIAWLASLPLLHTPSLAVLQALLLLVQRRPTNKHVSDTPFKWTMMTTAVSIAQALGINRDPSGWPLPPWEIKVRKRLAWATYIQDKWIALNFGRSSHIQADDWDVVALTEDDFFDKEHFPPDPICVQYFLKLCELSQLVDQIAHELFSLRATRTLHGSLEATMEVAKPLRARLHDWYQSLPAGVFPKSHMKASPSLRKGSYVQELDGGGSLQLAYITVKIELFRAMLRPLVNAPAAPNINALRNGALDVGREILDFLAELDASEMEAFWASYSRTNFTIASNFMLALFVTSPSPEDAAESLALLNAWRSLLRLKSRSCDMLNLALLRLDSAYVCGIERAIELSPWAAHAWARAGRMA